MTFGKGHAFSRLISGVIFCLQVSFTYINSSAGLYDMFPSTASIPINSTGCPVKPPTPTYSNDSLISPCQIVPLIARLTLPPPGISSLMCISSPPPNCSTITCRVSGTQDYVRFKMEPCNYIPPAIALDNYVNGTRVLHKEFSKTLDFNFTSRKVPMRVTLTQHTQALSLGFQVNSASTQ